MSGRETVDGSSQKGSIMDTSGVIIGSATLGITFATISHPNPIKKVISTICKAGSVCHTKHVPFIVSTVLMILATTRTSSTTVAIT